MLELHTGFILPALDITVPGSTIRLKRLRFSLKLVLNRIALAQCQLSVNLY